ncbi:hypothetical protein VWX35_09040 [Phaeobacter sp. A36a-5a]|uniref:hypothetical protein n=1 Tax=Phaeobacter bryozoorum TaxID=1086632 RepID=UPI0030C9B7F9
MYSPVGFVPFSMVLDAAADVARQHVGESYSGHQIELGKAIPWKATKERFERREAEESLLTAWLISKAMTEVGAYVCSPSGTILRSAHLLHFHNDMLDWYEWPSDVSSHDELSGPFNRAIGDGSNHPLCRFRFINALTGTISVAEREAEILANFYQQDEYGLTQIAVAKQFELWAVCFQAEDMQPNAIETLQALLERNTEQEYSSSVAGKPLRGRRRKVDKAMLAYDTIYPHGHGAKTWPEVAGEVSEMTEETIHHETLMKALNKRKRLLAQD